MFLWGLLFVAVPVIIHFFERRRTIRLEFSSIRFLRDTAVKASRRKRLKRLLLLLTRICTIAAIVLLFAQPYDRLDPFGVLRDPQGRTFVWVDPTISMDYRADGAALWEHARRGVWALDSILPKSHKLYVFDNCLGEFVERGETGESACPGVRHGETTLRAALRTFDSRRRSGAHLPTLVLFSDFERHDAGIIDTFLSVDSLFHPVVCVSLAPERGCNYSLTAASGPGAHGPFVDCLVRARGQKLRQCDVSVLSGTLRTGHGQVECGRDDSVEVRLETGGPEQSKTGAVRLGIDDPFMHDNTDYFVAESRRLLRVLIVSNDNSAFPLAAALASLHAPSSYAPVIRRPAEVVFEDIDSAEIIVLNGVAQPTGVLRALFAKRSLEKKLIVFSPDMVDEQGAFNRDVLRHLGATAAVEKRRAETALYPVLPDTVSVLWRAFPRFEDRSVAVYEYLAALPGKPLLHLSNRSALVTQCIDSAEHCWIVLSTPIGISRSNNLAETGFYVPLIDRMLRFGLSLVRPKEHVWVAGFRERNPFYGATMPAQVYDAQGRQYAQWGGQFVVGFETPGVYKIQPPEDASYWVSVHADTREGQLAYRRPEPRGERKRYVKVLDERAFDEFVQTLGRRSRLNILWILVGLLLLAELALWEWRKPG